VAAGTPDAPYEAAAARPSPPTDAGADARMNKLSSSASISLAGRGAGLRPEDRREPRASTPSSALEHLRGGA